jgi:hypothetical protein
MTQRNEGLCGEKKEYRNGLVTVRELTPDEIEEFRGLKPGVTQTQSMIRCVAIQDGVMSVLDTTCEGFSRSLLKL